MKKIYHCYYDKCATESQELPGILYLKKKGQICFYDSEQDLFLDEKLQPFDITGAYIIPHNYVSVAQSFHNAVKEHGGILPADIDLENEMHNWLNYYKPIRKMRDIKGRELQDLNILKELEQSYGLEMFFKTKTKSFYGIVKIEDLKNPKTVISRALAKHPNDDFLISEVVNIKTDELGRKEYRIFVYNNEILNISRYTECFLHRIEPEVYRRAQEILEQLKSTALPATYVMDLFEYEDKNGNTQIDVLEFNGTSAAGRYLYNSINLEPTDDMLHEDPTNIAIEKRPLVSLCLVPTSEYKEYISSFRSSIYCDKKGTFGYDLKKLDSYNSIVDFGKKFNLGRVIEEEPVLEPSINEKNKQELSTNEEATDDENSSILSEMQKIAQQAYIDSEEYAKLRFLELLNLEECPVKEMHLTRFGMPRPELKEIPKVIKLRPEFLKRIQDEHKK